MISYKKGDILQDQADALVNPVNTIGVMGKGLALQFKKSFPEKFLAYKQVCNNKTLVTGRLFTFPTGSLTPPFYIINFPTKAHWKDRSKLAYIEQGMQALKHESERLELHSVAIPPLGCGLGGLNWKNVNQIIRNAVADSDVEWRLYIP